MRQLHKTFYSAPAGRQLGLGPVLIAAAVLLLAAAGSLLWWRQGEAVFESIVKAAIAWCF